MGIGVTLQDAIDRSRVTEFPIEADLDLLFAIAVNDRVTMAKELERLRAIVDRYENGSYGNGRMEGYDYEVAMNVEWVLMARGGGYFSGELFDTKEAAEAAKEES